MCIVCVCANKQSVYVFALCGEMNAKRVRYVGDGLVRKERARAGPN